MHSSTPSTKFVTNIADAIAESVRIVRALLSDPTILWRQAELVKRTGATSGLVSRIITHLLRQGLN